MANKTKTFAAFALAALAGAGASAKFTENRSVMSPAYWKIWNEDVQKKIDADIEKHRKADAEFAVSAPDGAEVKVEQLTHAFFFGAHIFNFNQLGTRERNARYKELFGTLFNSATIPFFWRSLERHPGAPRFEERYEDTEEYWNNCKNPKEQPHWRRPPPDPLVSFLRSKGVRIHGHPLVWGNNTWMTPNWLWDSYCPESEKKSIQRASGVPIPRWDPAVPAGAPNKTLDKKWEAAWGKIYRKMTDEQIAALVPSYLKAQSELYERRVREIAARYGNMVDCWDVVNESATDYQWRLGRKAVRKRPFDRSWYGPMPADYAWKAFMWAGKYLPERAWFSLNDYNNSPSFVQQAKDLAANGARISVIGSQMHLFDPEESKRIREGKGPAHITPAKIAERFDLLSRAGRPILLSETTISAPDDSADGWMVQAVIARNLFRAWFSVEKMVGITWWNVVDDCGAPGEPTTSGMFTRDMKPKTVYYAIDDLVNREWKTNISVKAKGGKVKFRGFRGTYRITWKDAKGVQRGMTVDVK